MRIKKRNLVMIIESFLKEENETDDRSNEDQLQSLIDSYRSKSVEEKRTIAFFIRDALRKSNSLEGEAISIIDAVIKHLINEEPMTPESIATTQKLIIAFICTVYDAKDETKRALISFWDDYARHVLNPAAPFAVISTLAGVPGLSVVLYFLMEAVWFIDQDLYYELSDLDAKSMKALANAVTLGGFETAIDNVNAQIAANDIELILSILQMYSNPAIANPVTLTVDGKSYVIDGTAKTKTEAKENIKRLITKEIIPNSISSAIKSTAVNYLSTDPEKLHKQEKESIEKSSGTTAAKFNVLDRI